MKNIWLSSQQRDINIYIKLKIFILKKFYYLQWELVKAEVGFPQYFQLQSPVFISAFFLAFFNIVVHLSLSMNCAFGRALNGSTIVVISCGHYSHHALCVFIYLSDSHLAAITNASNCNQQPLGAFNASAAPCHRWVSPWVNARQLLRSFCVYYPWIDACSCYKSNKTYYKCLSQSPPLPSSSRSPPLSPSPSVRSCLELPLLFRLKRLEMCQQSDKFRTNYAAATNDDDDDN